MIQKSLQVNIIYRTPPFFHFLVSAWPFLELSMFRRRIRWCGMVQFCPSSPQHSGSNCNTPHVMINIQNHTVTLVLI